MNLFLRSKLLFIVIFAICFSEAKADIWSDIGKCFIDPCSCGQSGEVEQWSSDGKTMKELSKGTYDYDKSVRFSIFDNYQHVYKPKGACPPFSKFNGREGCLKQFRPPIEGGGWANANYRAYCAEASPNSTFANPLVRVRMQACNFMFCFTKVRELNGLDGECVIWPTQYGIPTIRFCARVAIPRLSKDNQDKLLMTPDPGYYFHFLDTHGFPRPDPGIITSNNETLFIPKICVYEDPSVYEGLTAWMEPYRNSGMDFFDMIPDRMPYHNFGPGANNTSPSFMDILTFSMTKNEIVESSYFFSAGQNDSLYYPIWSEQAGSALVTDSTPFNPEEDIKEKGGIKNAEKIMGYTVDMRWKNDYENWLNDFVYRKKDSLGCSYLPIGPYPQPFCPLPAGSEPGILIQEICPHIVEYDSNLMKKILRKRKSTSMQPCVNSSLGNNFINNSVRASLEDIIPICAKDSDDPKKQGCAKLSPSTLTAKIIHEQAKDMLKVCSDSDIANGTPCVITKYNAPSCPSGGLCEKKMRVVYGYKMSGVTPMKSIYGYPTDTVSECKSSNVIYPCVSIFGINKGQYADISLNLGDSRSNLIPSDPQKNKGYGKYKNDIVLSGMGDSRYYLSTYISYSGDDTEVTSDDGALIRGNSMCMYYVSSDSNINFSGCVKRAPFPNLKAESCTTDSCYSEKELSSIINEGIDSESMYHYYPRMKLKATYKGVDVEEGVNVPSDEIVAIVGARNLAKGPYGDSTRMYYDFLGVDIDTLALDDSIMIPPFTSIKAPIYGGVIILGDYYNNITPLSNSPQKDFAKYLGGIEYVSRKYENDEIVSGEYIRGSNRLAAGTADYTPCHMVTTVKDQAGHTRIAYDDSNCVLALLNHYDKVDCSAFKSKGITKRCSNDDKRICSVNSSLGTGNNIIYFRSCGNVKCYETSLEKDVCVPSLGPSDRLLPRYEAGAPLDIPGKFYDMSSIVTDGICARTNTSELYNQKKCGTRDKTIIERGVSISIPDLYCPEIKFVNESTGNALWTKAKVGQKAVGTCGSGFGAPPGGLKDRLCFGTNDKKTRLEDLTFNTTCLKGYCEPITNPDASSGYATWSGSYYPLGIPSAQCPEGYQSPKFGFSQRKCNKEISGKYYLSDLKKEEFCYRNEVALSGGSALNANKYNLNIVTSRGNSYGTGSPQFANINVTGPTRYGEQTYQCCTKRGSFGSCSEMGTCYSNYGYDKYVVEVGYPEYWRAFDANRTIEWIENATNGVITARIDDSSRVPNGYILKNLKVISNNSISTLRFDSNAMNTMNNYGISSDCTDNPANCIIAGDTGVNILKSNAGTPYSNIYFGYYNSDWSSGLTGGGLRFEIHIPLGAQQTDNSN